MPVLTLPAAGLKTACLRLCVSMGKALRWMPCVTPSRLLFVFVLLRIRGMFGGEVCVWRHLGHHTVSL